MLKQPFLTRLVSYSQHGFDTNLSHPILKIKWNAKSYVRPEISHSECRAPLPTGTMTRSLYTDGQRPHYIQPGTHPSCAIKVTTNKLENVIILS